MSYLPRNPGATTADWSDLADELTRWEEVDRVAVLWWRDDDAISATPRLSDLLRLAAGTPLALAVIPALAEPELADALADAPSVAVLQHGWRHADHARHGKKSEYPADRSDAEVRQELAAGKARLAMLFGPRALPVLVPPWNRFAGDFLPLLPQVGIRAISAIPSRVPLPPGLVALDVHVDPVAWRGDRGFVGEPAALGPLIRQLQARRVGAEPPDRPIGLLTHHLGIDAATEAFIERLIAVTGPHRAVRWAAVTELLR
jgi:peptidoglycan/xylan/chitin deacetylase (PgdA/CDA1 family)